MTLKKKQKDYELKWLLDLHFEYANKTKKDADLLSDWEPDLKKFVFPEKLVHKALKYDKRNFNYHFLYALKPIKKHVAQYYNKLEIYSEKLRVENIAILPSVTNALYLMLLAFKNKGLINGLGVRPIYFSIRDACSDFNINLDLIDSFSDEDYVADLERILGALRKGSYNFLILTNPIYCAGKQLEPHYIKEIQKVCVEREVLLVMDEAFIIPWGGGAEEFREYSATKTVVIRSPMKALFINGIKVATLTGPSWLVKETEGVSTHVIGGITFPQLNLIDNFFAQTPEIKKEIKACEENNYGFLNRNYDEIKKMTQEYKEFHLAFANSNPYGMIECKNIPNDKKVIEKVIRNLLFKTGCMILPSWRYSFTTKNNPFAFRINLARANKKYVIKLRKILDLLRTVGE